MKDVRVLCLGLFVFGVLILAPEIFRPSSPPIVQTTGCSPQVKAITDVLVKKLLAECIAENPELNDVELQKICQFADDLWPLVRDLVSAQKRGLAKASASRDGGTDASCR